MQETSGAGHFSVVQPGSSVATALSEGEAKPKHVLILEILGEAWRAVKHPLHSVRPFIWRSVRSACGSVHPRSMSPSRLSLGQLCSFAHVIHCKQEQSLPHSVLACTWLANMCLACCSLECLPVPRPSSVLHAQLFALPRLKAVRAPREVTLVRRYR